MVKSVTTTTTLASAPNYNPRVQTAEGANFALETVVVGRGKLMRLQSAADALTNNCYSF